MLNLTVFFPSGWRTEQIFLGSGYFVYGARSAGKSSFVFQAAINTVLGGGTVLVLCHEQCVSQKVPQPFTALTTLTDEQLNRLEFAYVSDWESAIKELLDMDEKTSDDDGCMPDMIIVEDEGWYNANSKDNRYSRGMVDSQRATFLSILENVRNRLALSGRDLTFVVVSNDVPLEYTGVENKLELPLSNFPFVEVRFASCGLVKVVPLPSDTTARTTSFSLLWKDGLQLCE